MVPGFLLVSSLAGRLGVGRILRYSYDPGSSSTRKRVRSFGNDLTRMRVRYLWGVFSFLVLSLNSFLHPNGQEVTELFL